MQWRKRRFVIAVLSTAIIFAMTLVLTGLANGLRVEANKTVDALGVDEFVVKEGRVGSVRGLQRRSRRSTSAGSRQFPVSSRRLRSCMQVTRSPYATSSSTDR